MKKRTRILAGLPVAVAALMLGAGAPVAWAGDEEAIPLDEANIFFELNHTDGDLGIHALIDGEGWKRLRIHDPHERRMLDIKVKGRLRRQGLTEIFFESAEPPFESDDPEEDTLTPEEFFNRFPPGIYEIEAMTLDGEELEGESEITHVMPAPADGILINGMAAAENCDAEDLPEVASGPVTIDWDPVTSSHPDLGASDPDIEIVAYQLVTEYEDENEDEQVFSVFLPPSVTEMEVPAGFIELSEEFKFEILARESSGNQTGVESCFTVAE